MTHQRLARYQPILGPERGRLVKLMNLWRERKISEADFKFWKKLIDADMTTEN